MSIASTRSTRQKIAKIGDAKISLAEGRIARRSRVAGIQSIPTGI